MSDTFTRYGSNITNVWQEILTPVTLAFSYEVVPKINENPSIFVKVTAKKSVAHFLSGHGVYTPCPEKRDRQYFGRNFDKKL